MEYSDIRDINKDRVLECFLELVRIDSPSRHEAGVASYCKSALEEIGFSVRIDESAQATGSDTGNVVAFLPGSSSNSGSIVLGAHMDTVDPACGIEPVITDGLITSAGDTVLGSDDKSGVASIIEAARCIVEQEAQRPNILIVFTTCEEIGLQGASNLKLSEEEREMFSGSICLIPDSDGLPSLLTIGAPFHYDFKAVFKGKAAHAAVAPEKGIHAISMAADAISNMRLGSLGEVMVANVGTIEGGSADNVIPDSCRISGECRALRLDDADRIKDEMQACMERSAEKFGGSVETQWKLSHPGICFERDDEFVLKLEDISKRLGFEFEAVYSAGASDANVLTYQGFRPITIGSGMMNFHSVDECIKVESLWDCSRFILNAMCDLA